MNAIAAVNLPLAGLAAFVTGGSKGIGRAISICLATAGAAVALTGRTSGTGEGSAMDTARRIENAGGRALPLLCDVREASAVETCINKAAAAFGRLDILVNNAGLFFPNRAAATIDLAIWDETITTHITGSLLCSRFAIPHMKAAGGGSIINLSSGAADRSYNAAGNIAYAVAKAGIEQLTRGLAQELASENIAVNAIRPMSLLTEGSRRENSPEQLRGFSDATSICASILHLSQRRAEFSGHCVRRTDFTGSGFSQTVSDTL